MDKVLFSSKSMEWETPQSLFDQLNAEFHFDLDVASTDQNAKCERHFTKEQDGLKQEWGSVTVWCNPPYGRQLPAWVKKCYEESKNGSTVVMLIPARTDTRWFHDYIYGQAEIRFIKGRLYFAQDGTPGGRSPFPSMIVIFNSK